MFWAIGQYSIAGEPLGALWLSYLTTSWLVIFNGYVISDCSEIFAEEWNYDDVNEIDLETYNAPQIDWGGVLWYFTRWKTLEFKIIIKANSLVELNDKLDELKSKLVKREWDLEININSETRVYKASLTDLKVNRDFAQENIQSDIRIQFRAMNDAYSKIATSETQNNVIWNISLDIQNEGTAKADFKVYIIFGVGNVWVNTITLINNWYSFIVNQSINDGNIIQIDWQDRKVMYNLTEIDYTWIFQQLQPWSNPMQLQFNWTTLSCTVTTIFNKNWL